jgi:hypothetical protein
MERNPHAGETKDVALVMMLFETVRLSAEHGNGPAAARRQRHRHGIPANAE